MIGHQQFEQRLARIQNLFRIGDHLHSGFHRTYARSGKYARAGIHDAQTADADGSLVLQMAQRGNADAVHPCGIENGGSVGHAHGFPVDRDVDHSERCGGGRHFMVVFPPVVLLPLATRR